MTSRLRAVGALAAALAVGVVGLAPASRADGARVGQPPAAGAGRSRRAPARDRRGPARAARRHADQPVPSVVAGGRGGAVAAAARRTAGSRGPGGGRVGALSLAGSSTSCPWSFTARYTCFYADAGFNGRRLQFADTYCSGR